MLATCDVMVRLVSMVNSRSRINGEVSTSWPHRLTRVNDVGVGRLHERMTMACDLLSFIPLSQSHAFASCMQSSILARACMWSVGGKVM